MKICIDIQAAVGQGAGVGRYVRELAEHLNKLSQASSLAFFYFDFMRRGLSMPLANTRAVRWCPGRIAQSCWKRFAWPPFDWFAGAFDLYHFTNFIIPPLSRGKKVVTIYDVSFLRYPEFTEKSNLIFLNAKIGDTLRRADAIITISHFSASELVCFFPDVRDKIHVIYPGVMEHMRAIAPEGRADIEFLCGIHKPYILTVGTVEPRKNIEFLIQMFENMKDFRGKLVIVGRPGWKYASIIDRMHSSAKAADICLIQGASDAELNAIYSGAELFVFPSFYEGFGFPPLEAFVSGVPVLSSAAAALKEVLGAGAEIMDGYNAHEWAQEALAIINDKSRRGLMIDEGRSQASKYTWAETAKQTFALYRMLVS